jgi:hypothetical protein
MRSKAPGSFRQTRQEYEMSNEVTTARSITGNELAKLQSGTALTSGDDGWSSVPDRSGYIKGTMILVDGNSGKYAIGKVEVDAAFLERRFGTLGVVTSWVLWTRDSQGPIEYRVTQPGQRHPDEDELPSIPPEKWPLFNGVPQKRWRDTRLVYLACPRTGEQFTLVVSTWRGRASVADLKVAIMNVRMARPAAVPIVRLGTELRRDRFGVKPGPKFHIEDWSFPATVVSEVPKLAAGMNDNQQAPSAPTLSEQLNDSLPF